jgi:hypothetical protein
MKQTDFESEKSLTGWNYDIKEQVTVHAPIAQNQGTW